MLIFVEFLFLVLVDFCVKVLGLFVGLWIFLVLVGCVVGVVRKFGK